MAFSVTEGANVTVETRRGVCRGERCQDLRCQDLRGQDLRGQDLRGQDLRGQDLWRQDLRGQDLERSRSRRYPMTVSTVNTAQAPATQATWMPKAPADPPVKAVISDSGATCPQVRKP